MKKILAGFVSSLVGMFTRRAPEQDVGRPREGVPGAFVVLNPVSGVRDARVFREAIDRHFRGGGRAYELYETTGQEDLPTVVREALGRGSDMVVAVGGDGTVAGVAGGLVGTGVPMGIVPGGTANVFARELGIPLELDRALDLLVGGEVGRVVKGVDAIRVGERFFVLNVSVGISSLTIHDTGREQKRRFGVFAYIWSALTGLLKFRRPRFDLVVDGKLNRIRASEILIANGSALMPPLQWGPHIRPDDGKLDICIVRATALIGYPGLMLSILLGRQRQNPDVSYMSAERSVSISANRTLPVQADGEFIGETPVDVHVAPGAVHVIVPTKPESFILRIEEEIEKIGKWPKPGAGQV